VSSLNVKSPTVGRLLLLTLMTDRHDTLMAPSTSATGTAELLRIAI
jgi:hypothetical protein